MNKSPPSPEGLQDSPYAAELRRAQPASRFAAPMESDYRQGFVRESRTLVRFSCTLAVLLIALRGFEVLIGVGVGEPSPAAFLCALGDSIILAWLAWSRGYERFYLRWGPVLILPRSCLVAIELVRVAARGQLDVLMLLPLLLIGPFFFLGLRYRTGLLIVCASGASMLGAAIVYHLPPAVAFHSGAFAMISIATLAVAAQQMEKRSRRAFLESRLVAELAQHDVLTWTKNRRVFDEYLPRLWRQASEDGRSLAILLLDVDHFKPYNDRYGHQAGDVALRKVAQAIQACVRRPLDLVARYGGEEFTAILYDTDASRTAAVAERIRKAVEELAIEHRGVRAGAMLTISIGAAVIAPDPRRSPGGALQLADEALYRAKSKGRDRVEIVDDTEYRLLVTGVFSKDLAEKLKQSTGRH